MYLYLQLLCIFVILPNIILFYLNRKKIHLKTLLLSLFILFLIAILWDQLSVRMGLWSFSQNEILGSLFGLPIEEYLFFIFVPLLSINIYLLIEKILADCKKKKMNNNRWKWIEKKTIKRNVKNVGRALEESTTKWYNLIVSTLENLFMRTREKSCARNFNVISNHRWIFLNDSIVLSVERLKKKLWEVNCWWGFGRKE